MSKRFRILFLCAAAMSALMTAAALFYLAQDGKALPFHLVASLTLAVTLSMFLAAGLMGLIFLSSDSGYDQAAADEAAKHDPDDWLNEPR